MSQASSASPLRPILGAGVLSLVGLLALAGAKSYRDLSVARGRESRLEAEIRATEESRERLARRIRRLQADPVALEREVRHSLRWVRPGEVVLLVDEEEEPPPPAASEQRVSEADRP